MKTNTRTKKAWMRKLARENHDLNAQLMKTAQSIDNITALTDALLVSVIKAYGKDNKIIIEPPKIGEGNVSFKSEDGKYIVSIEN